MRRLILCWQSLRLCWLLSHIFRIYIGESDALIAYIILIRNVNASFTFKNNRIYLAIELGARMWAALAY